MEQNKSQNAEELNSQFLAAIEKRMESTDWDRLTAKKVLRTVKKKRITRLSYAAAAAIFFVMSGFAAMIPVDSLEFNSGTEGLIVHTENESYKSAIKTLASITGNFISAEDHGDQIYDAIYANSSDDYSLTVGYMDY